MTEPWCNSCASARKKCCLPTRILSLWCVECIFTFCHRSGSCRHHTKISRRYHCSPLGLLLPSHVSGADSWILVWGHGEFQDRASAWYFPLSWPWFGDISACLAPARGGHSWTWDWAWARGLGYIRTFLKDRTPCDSSLSCCFLIAGVSTPHRCWERHVLAFSQKWYHHLPLAMLFSFLPSLGNTATCLNSASTTSNGIFLLSKQTCGGWN